MDGKSMPGAGNVAIDAKKLNDSAKEAAIAIANSFNEAIKYICENLKTEIFSKDLQKSVNAFCASTQKAITEMFTAISNNLEKSLSNNSLKTKIRLWKAKRVIIDILSLPADLLKIYDTNKLKDIDKLNESLNKSILTISNALKLLDEIQIPNGLKRKLLSSIIAFTLASISLLSLSNFITIGAVIGAQAALAFPFIKMLQWTVDAISEMYKGMLIVIFEAVVINSFSSEIDSSLVLIETFLRGVNGVLSQLKGLQSNLIRQGRRKLRRLNRMIKVLIDCATNLCIIMIIAIPLLLSLLVADIFVTSLRILVRKINIIPIGGKTFKVLFGVLGAITILLLIGAVSTLFLLVGVFAILGILLSILMVLAIRLLVQAINKLTIDPKVFLVLLMVLTLFIVLTAVAFCLLLITKFIEDVIWENLLLFSVTLVAFVIGIIALGAFIIPLGFAFGAIALIAGSAGLLLLTAMALAELSKYGDEIELESVKSFIDSVTELAGKLSIFGFKSAFMIPFIGAALGAVLTICGAMGPMLLLAKELSLFDTSIDYKERMSGVLGIIDAVYEKSSEWNPIKMRILSYNMWQLRSVAKTLSKMADTVAKIARLNVPTKWDKDGNPTEFRAMKDTDFDNMHDNIGKIIGSFIDWTEDKDLLDLMIRASIAEDIFDDLEDIIKPIGQMAKVVQDVATMQIPNKWDNQGNVIGYELLSDTHITAVGTNIKKIIGCFTDWVDDGAVKDLEDKADDMEDIFDDLEDIISPIADMVDVVVKMASMQIADKWDDKGKAIHFTTLDDEMIDAATENVKSITKGFITSICGFGEDFWEYVEDAADAAEDAFDELEEIVDPIKTIVDMTVNMAKQQIPTEWDDEGKPIKYTTLDSTLIGQATANINTITTDFIKMLVGPGNPFVDKNYKDFVKIDDIMDSIEDAIDPIVSIVNLVKDMASMRIPDKWDKTGKPISYTKLTDDDFTSANTNINTIITGFISTLSSVSFTKEQQTQAEFAAKQISKITGAIEPVKGMVEIIQQVASGKFPIAFNSKGEATKWMQLSKMFNPDGTPAEEGQKFSGTIKGLITLPPKAIAEGLSNVGADISIIKGAQSNLKIMSSASATLGDMVKYLAGLDDSQVKRTKEVTENNIKWLDKISAINIDKVKTTAAMFHEMAEFSKSISGDFDKLADTLNEKLMKILEELRDVLKDTGESVDKLAEKKASGSSSATNSSKESPVAEAPAKEDEDKNKKVDLTQTNTKIDRVVTEIGALTAELARWRSNM